MAGDADLGWELDRWGDKCRSSRSNARKAVELLPESVVRQCRRVREWADVIEIRFGYRPTVRALRSALDSIEE